MDADYARTNPDAVAGDHVLITVTDTGTGMAPEILDRVFEPFFTTKETGRGTGLGLSMVYGFVRQSRGHVKISSELGRGTAVRIYLPRTHRSNGRTDVASERPEVPHGTESVLLVEDDSKVRLSVAEQLRTLGYRVTEAASGPAALGELEAAVEPFDLMLTDVVMPGGLHGDALAAAVASAGRRSRSCSCRATPTTPTSCAAGSIPTSCCSTSPSIAATWRRSCGSPSTAARVRPRSERLSAGNHAAAPAFGRDGPPSQENR